MATSSAFPTSNEYIKYRITVEENSQSLSGNYTNVTVSVRFYRTNSGYETYGSGTVYCTIDGIKYTASVTSSKKITSAGIVLFSKTLNVYHDDDGTKDLTVSAYISHSRFSSSAHSYTQTLPKIGRQSRITFPEDAILGSACVLNIEQYSPDYTHTIKYTCGDLSGVICENSSDTSVSFTPPLALAAANTTGLTVRVTLNIETFNGEESVGAYSKAFSCGIPESVVPSCTISVSDVYGYGALFDAYIKGKSALDITVNPVKAYGSDIVLYNIVVNEATYTTARAQTDLLKESGSVTIMATVTDQRGRKGTASVTVDVLEHTAPSITSFKVVRCNQYGEPSSSGVYAKAIFTNTATSLNDKNTVTYSLMYKKSTEQGYTSVTMPGFANTYNNVDAEFLVSESFDAAATYDVILSVQDAMSSTSKSTLCSSAYKLWSILRKGLGFAFGKIAELEGVFEVAFKTKLTGGMIHPIPNAETDLDTLVTPNTFRLPASGGYVNVPENDAEAMLYVEGDADVLRQRFIVFDNAGSREYERIYRNYTWSDWVNKNANAMLAAYPVGSIYITTSEADPTSIFGGSWERIKDKFLLASGESYNLNDTGGKASHTINHTHKHIAPVGSTSNRLGLISVNGTVSGGNGKAYQTTPYDASGSLTSNVTLGYTSDATINDTVPTMPPYLAVNVWKRIG